MDEGLTDHQRRCLEHERQARVLGIPLAEYARGHGFSARMVYDALAQLKKKEVIGADVKSAQLAKRASGGRASDEKSAFVAVRIEPAQAQTGTFLPVLRLNHVRGHVLEFGSWPPAEVMAVILAGGCDVAA